MRPHLIRKIVKTCRELGRVDATLYLLQRVLSRLPGDVQLLKYYLLAQPVPLQPLSNRPHRLTIRVVTREEYQVDWFPRPAEVIETRFDQGSICMVAFAEQTPLACVWLHEGLYDEDTVRCRFIPQPADEAVWDFDVFVDPDHRLGRTFLQLWDYAFQWMREHKISWSMSRIDAFNQTSLRSHRRLGAVIVNRVVFLRLGRRQYSWTSQKPRWVISQKYTPTITVSAPGK